MLKILKMSTVLDLNVFARLVASYTEIVIPIWYWCLYCDVWGISLNFLRTAISELDLGQLESIWK